MPFDLNLAFDLIYQWNPCIRLRILYLFTTQLIEDSRYLWFNVLIREAAKALPFTDVNAKACSPFLQYLFQDL